jgi:ERCC4-type nuclease
MIIKRDNREQIKLEFKHKSIKKVIDCTLNVGDYRAVFDDGFEPQIVFERKNISDLYGSLSGGYSRFKLEMERAKEQNLQLIIIVEANLSRVLCGVPYSQRTPESIVYQIFTLRARYDIETVFCKDRDEVSEYITQYFIAHEKEYMDKKLSSPSLLTKTEI